ncbi:MAG: hypothetical protein GMKNLPBB_03227 [Myxococcota bacterium]|nr:hypothetical protein [Myxococcota bacterium]
MKRNLTLGSLLIAAALGMSGCTDANQSFFIAGMVPLTPGCNFPVQPFLGTLRLQTGGLVDVSGPNFNYIGAAMVVNAMDDPSFRFRQQQSNNTRTFYPLSGHVKMKRFEVEVVLPEGSPLSTTVAPYQVRAVGSIPFVGAIAPQAVTFGFEFIPRDVILAFRDDPFMQDPDARAEIVLRMRGVGETVGGTSMETGLIEYPIDLCNGCINRLPGGLVENCPAGSRFSVDPQTFIAYPCNGLLAGQDLGDNGALPVYCTCPRGANEDGTCRALQ